MAMSLIGLPVPQQTYAVFTDGRAPPSQQASAAASLNPPSYGSRAGFVPRSVADFGDGGAFPEIHVAQYPLNLGRPGGSASGSVLTPTVDATGTVHFDALVKREGQTVHSRFTDLVETNSEQRSLERPTLDEEAEVAGRTMAALSKIVGSKVSAARAVKMPEDSATRTQAPTYIRYTPSGQGGATSVGAKQRIIRMVEAPQDPLEPPKFQHKKVPRGPPSPPVPVMHSPPRKVTVQDQQDWKIPPCVSNWKNSRGYTIPLDKRLAADGRGLQEVTINDNFAKLSESLYIAERRAREEVEMRASIQRKLLTKEKERKEEELRDLAARARMERSGVVGVGVSNTSETSDASDGKYAAAPGGGKNDEEHQAQLQRERLRMERKRERERDLRLEAAGKKAKTTRDHERDVSERIALGMAVPKATGGEGQFDERLFNQSKGMSSGFGDETEYNVYTKALYNRDSQKIYRPRAEQNQGTAQEQLDELRANSTRRFQPERDFKGVDRNRPQQPRTEPVQFEREAEQNTDPFGLDVFLSEASKGRKALDKISRGGTMAASAGGSRLDAETDVGSHRSRVAFTSATE